MIVLFFGAPGSGKGTQAKIISNHLKIPHLATGDILRKAISDQTPLGLQAKEVMDSGGLVSDKTMINIVRVRIKEEDCANGFILDGFPRTHEQAIALNDLLELESLVINTVFYLSIEQSILAERITGRRISETGGYEYHLKYKPPKQEGICDVTGSKLIQREDDTLENVQKRLKIFNEVTLPLVNFYQERGLLNEIDASQPIEKVTQEILNLLDT